MKVYLFLAILICASMTAAAEPAVTFQKGDHVCIIGGGLADRMQHSGYLEALLHAKFPDHNLVFRNLGFAGDEVTTRLRSEGFGTPDEWLKHERADFVLVFFGYNESFKGEAGVKDFRDVLEKFIAKTLEQKYNDKSVPQIVLFSPTAAEKHSDPNFPDPGPLNRNIKLYVDAMRQVAKSSNVAFIDLFAPSQELYKEAKTPLTINAVHLTDDGYKALAPAMFDALVGGNAQAMEGEAFEKLRTAVNQKNEVWFSRYRTMDGYNVYGGRSFLKFDGIMNRDTMQREMEMRDVMTANRDKRVWAVAGGGDLTIDDSNLPAPVEVKTNKPGELPDGSHKFISGEDAIKHMKVPPGCKVNLFASEEQFPDLAKPVQMAFDTKGRLWVAAWPNYPERTPQSTKGDSLLVFEDTDNDGRADKVTPFLDDLNCPTGFQFYKDGVIVVQAPDVWFVRDTDGDGKGDWKERILNGLDSADSHHTANAIALEPGGAIYLSDGVFHRTQMETPWGPPVRNIDAAIYRFEPRTSKIERYVSYGFANPHGRVFDAWGNDLITDATGNNTYFGPAFSGNIDYPAKHSELKQFWERPSRPCPGTAMLSSTHFPEEFQGNYLNANVIGFQGIYRVKVKEEGSGVWGETIEPHLVESDDPNFRPTAVDVAPDGSIYFLDWHNPIIGHMQHHLRDPNRDHTHGRIYRMTYEGRELTKPAIVDGQPIEALLDLLKAPENNVRTRAKIEIGKHDSKQVIDALEKWSGQFDPKKMEDQHALLETLWVYQWHNLVNEKLLGRMLESPEPRARAQAVRVVCYWRDRVKEPLKLIRTAANDPSPRVRLEAVRAASFFEGIEAMEVAHDILKYELDYYLDYTFKETTRQLAKSVEGIYLPKDAKALETLVGRLSDQDLLKAHDEEAVLAERMQRPGLNINVRTASLNSLTKLHDSDPINEAIAMLRRMDAEKDSPVAALDLGFVLASYPPEDLARKRGSFKDLAHDAAQVPVRLAAYAALVAADGKPDAAWADTSESAAARGDLIESISLHADADFRSQFAPMILRQVAAKNAPTELHQASLRALPLIGSESAGEGFAMLSTHVREGRDMSTAARAIMQLPRESWDKTQAAPLADAIVKWAKSIPAADRTAVDYIDTVQLGNELAMLLPAANATNVRKELRDLGVRVIVLRSVREQMRYDIQRIVVEAGKPVEIVFENVDMMPHNIVVIEPGSRQEIGPVAEKMEPNPDSKGRTFVPNDKRILAASKMVEPGMKETLKLTAPKTPGDYEYFCTYPEHWQRMWGQLVVVKDEEAYLAASAVALPPISEVDPEHEHEH